MQWQVSRGWGANFIEPVNPIAPKSGAILNLDFMETEFIEHLDQLYDAGYGEQFKEDNPDAFYRQLAEFENHYRSETWSIICTSRWGWK